MYYIIIDSEIKYWKLKQFIHFQQNINIGSFKEKTYLNRVYNASKNI